MLSECRLRVAGGGDRLSRAREGDEERVALSVDLDAVVLLPGAAKQFAVSAS